MTGPQGNHFILFLKSQTLIYLRNNGNCYPWDESLIVNYSQVCLRGNLKENRAISGFSGRTKSGTRITLSILQSFLHLT